MSQHVNLDYAFLEDGHREPKTEFPFHELDGEYGELDPLVAASDAFGRMLGWAWGDGRGFGNPRSAYFKFLAASAVIRPDLFGNASYEQLAEENNRTKAWASALALEFQDRFGVHFRRSRRESTRKSFRKARMNSFQKSHVS